MPTPAEALRFVNDPQTSLDKLRRACDLLGVPSHGSQDDIRARVVAHVEALAPGAAVVCLNPCM